MKLYCLALLSLLPFTSELSAQAPDSQAKKPNIIFFFADDLGYGDLGCFWQDQKKGDKKFDTPGIDAMAATGVKMTHHYISAPVCAPSRASFFQGRHQGHSDVRDSQFDKALANNHTVANVLKRAGYRTIHVGKNGLAGSQDSVNLEGEGSKNIKAHPLDRGFDDFFGYLFHEHGHEHYPRNGSTNKKAYFFDQYRRVENASHDLYTTDAFTAYAKKAIIEEANDGDDQPFFLYLAYDAPHQKMQRPPVAYPEGLGLNGGVKWTNEKDAKGMVRYANTATGEGKVDGFNHPENHHSWPEKHQQHVGMIRRIDNSVADVLQLLKDLNLDDNTLCVFSSDNGPHNENHRPDFFESFGELEGIKRDMWEGGIRVPTVVRWPGQLAGVTGSETNPHEVSYPSAIWDWMPTFADLAGVPAPAWCDGVSLVPVLTGKGKQRDKGYLYFEFTNHYETPNYDEFPNHGGRKRGQMQCLRIGDYMGIRTQIKNADTNFEIYNVVNDPSQSRDLRVAKSRLHRQMKDLALQARRPLVVSRPYDKALVPAVEITASPGLTVSSYEGHWDYIPEFRDLKSINTTEVTDFDLTSRSRDEDFGLLFTGFIKAPKDGEYHFNLKSDSGTQLFIHDAHVIDDDYNHKASGKSRKILLKAGLHPIRLYYRHGKTKKPSLTVNWSGPGFEKQAVPKTALFSAAKSAE